MSRYKAIISAAPDFAYALCTSKIKDEELDGIDLSTLANRLQRRRAHRSERHQKVHGAVCADGVSKPKAMTPGYGLAEAGLAVSFSHPLGRLASRNSMRRSFPTRGGPTPGPGRRIVSVGKAGAWTRSSRCTTTEGREVAPGTVGTIMVQGPSVTPGYYNDPELSQPHHPERLARHRRPRLHPRRRSACVGAPERPDHHPRAEHAPQQIEHLVAGVDGLRIASIAAVGCPSTARANSWSCSPSAMPPPPGRMKTSRRTCASASPAAAIDSARHPHRGVGYASADGVGQAAPVGSAAPVSGGTLAAPHKVERPVDGERDWKVTDCVGQGVAEQAREERGGSVKKLILRTAFDVRGPHVASLPHLRPHRRAIRTACRRADRSIASACRRRPNTTAFSSSGRTAFRMPARRSRFPRISCASTAICLPDLVNGLGFGFATNSYSKTGLAILEGKADILDLVDIFAHQKGAPRRSTSSARRRAASSPRSSVEQSPDVFSAGVGRVRTGRQLPVSDQLLRRRARDVRIFLPGLIPGDPFNPDPSSRRELARLSTSRSSSRSSSIRRTAASSISGRRVAKLPFVETDYLNTGRGVGRGRAALHASSTSTTPPTTLGGFPFDNRSRWYSGSDNDLLLNICRSAHRGDPAARRRDEHVVRHDRCPHSGRSSRCTRCGPAGAVLSRSALHAEDDGVGVVSDASPQHLRSIASSTATSRRTSGSLASR